MKGINKKIRQELDALINKGDELREILRKLALDANPKKIPEDYADRYVTFIREYHGWYTRSLAVVRHIIPDRLEEFERLYHIDKRKDIGIPTYAIEDYLHGMDISKYGTTAFFKFENQVSILKSALLRLDDILANIQGVLQADLFDSEIDAAKHLKKNGHLRAAGVVASVVLESHLSKVCQNHEITIRKTKPSIGDFNSTLYDANIYDIVIMRKIQHLGDIRKLCVHKKEREPTPEEVQELIEGVDKVIKTIA